MTVIARPLFAPMHGPYAPPVGTIFARHDREWVRGTLRRLRKTGLHFTALGRRRCVGSCWRGCCDKASPSGCLMLHLRSRYVSKAAILTVPARPCWSKIEVPLEFQGLGPLQRRI